MFRLQYTSIMKAKSILLTLVKESTNLEMIGSIQIPEEGYRDFLTAMFGQGTHEASGIIRPGNTYLYAYGEELDVIYDVLLRNDDKECIALIKVD